MRTKLEGKRILLTGGSGFLGSFVAGKLREKGCQNIFIPRSKDYDLVKMEDVLRVYKDAAAEIVIHLAAKVGGIGANLKNPGKFFYDNIMMGAQMIEVARQYNIEKFVMVSTVCAYPKYTPVPFKEEDLWNGYPEETNAPYGIAKRALLVQLEGYRKQYGLDGIYLLVVNLYGPRDNFDLETSHVIPAIIRKCYEAKEKKEETITLWGSGKPTREFLYVEDAAEGIVCALESYNEPEPINLGSGEEISIEELARLIARLVGFEGKIIWDTSKPDGQLRRRLDTEKAKEKFGFVAKTPLNEGLKKTIEWYKNHMISNLKFDC